MSSDNPDKTLFRQPTNGDNTVVRPTPGGGRRGHPQPLPVYKETMAETRRDHPVAPGFLTQSPYIQPEYGLNPLIASASALLVVFEKTRVTLNHPNVDELYQRLVAEIKLFEARVRERGIKSEIVLTARYVICTALDESVLNTPWGGESKWPQQTLLSSFHGETSGGEKFFLILERLRSSPRESIHLLELIYLCLSLGFEGKYKLAHRGRDALEKIRDDLFAIIRASRGEYERSLSPSWSGMGRVRSSLTSHIPPWVAVVAILVLLVLIYSGFRYALHYSSASEVQKLVEITDKINTVKQ